jgi:TldD protein
MELASSKHLTEKKPLCEKLLKQLLQSYSYASVLAVDSVGKSYSIAKSGINIGETGVYTEMSYVVKVYDGESYGEYTFNQLTEDKLSDIVAHIGQNLMPWKEHMPEGLGVRKFPVIPEEKLTFSKSTQFEINPMEVSDGEIMDQLSTLRNQVLAADEILFDCSVRFSYQIYHKLFLSPNKDMEQNVMWSTGGFYPMALRENEVMESSASVSGDAGLEILKGLEAQIPKALEQLHLLLISEPMIPGEYDCICTPDVTGLIVHEAFGHGVEMDMFVKDRALAKEYIGEYVASPLVTMHDGAAAASQTASFFFDDEGTLAQETVIIDHGILKQGICDAQAAMSLGVSPTGNGRRQSAERKAYTRMTNTYFEPGTDRLEDMIASISYGFLLDCAGGGMEDPKNWGIQCMVELAREIKDGKFTGRTFSPVVMTGYVPDLLKSISMMSEELELSGTGMCGKGHKEWVKVSLGGPCIKARIRLG